MPEEIPRNRNYRPQQMQGQQQQFAPPQQAQYEPARQTQASSSGASCLVMSIVAIGAILLLVWLVPLVLGWVFTTGGCITLIIILVILSLIFGNNNN